MTRLPLRPAARPRRRPAARRRLAGALVALWLLPATGAAASIEGVAFEPEVRVDRQVLRLHRAALMRYRVFFKVYVAGLYLGPGVSPDRVLEDVPRRLEIAYLRGFTAEQFRKVTVSGIRQNVDPETFARLGPKIEALNRLYRPVRAGDRYALTHLPGRGTELSLNGSPLGLVPGEAFSRAVFSIWLGPEPFDEDLKRELLADA